jgi:hypothetical protein
MSMFSFNAAKMVKNNLCLKPILLHLNFLRFFGGFPLKISCEDHGTKVHFECLQGLKLVFSFLVLNLIACCVGLYHIFILLTTELVITEN